MVCLFANGLQGRVWFEKNPFVVSPYNDTIEGFLPLSLVKIGSITEFYHSWNRSIVPKRSQCIGLDKRSLTTCRQTNSTKLILKLASITACFNADSLSSSFNISVFTCKYKVEKYKHVHNVCLE